MSEIKVAADRYIFAMGANSWGRGSTEKEALKNWKANLSWRAGREVTVVLIDASKEAWVDEMGGIVTPNGKERPKKIKDMVVKVRK